MVQKNGWESVKEWWGETDRKSVRIKWEVKNN